MIEDKFVNVVGLCDAVHILKDGTGWSVNMLAKSVRVSSSTMRAWLHSSKERPLFIDGRQRWALRTRLRSVRRFEVAYLNALGVPAEIEVHVC